MSVNDLKKVYVDVSSSNDELSDSSDVSQIMLTDKLKTLLPNEATTGYSGKLGKVIICLLTCAMSLIITHDGNNTI